MLSPVPFPKYPKEFASATCGIRRIRRLSAVQGSLPCFVFPQQATQQNSTLYPGTNLSLRYFIGLFRPLQYVQVRIFLPGIQGKPGNSPAGWASPTACRIVLRAGALSAFITTKRRTCSFTSPPPRLGSLSFPRKRESTGIPDRNPMWIPPGLSCVAPRMLMRPQRLPVTGLSESSRCCQSEHSS